MANKRVRDYAKEYLRRIQKGLSRGLSRSAARGHAGKKHLSATELNQIEHLPRQERREVVERLPEPKRREAVYKIQVVPPDYGGGGGFYNPPGPPPPPSGGGGGGGGGWYVPPSDEDLEDYVEPDRYSYHGEIHWDPEQEEWIAADGTTMEPRPLESEYDDFDEYWDDLMDWYDAYDLDQYKEAS